MAYVRHESRLDRRDDMGVSLRATLELRASQGSEQAVADLAPPEFPESLTYLLGWAHEVVGRSGVGMSGMAPLSWSTLEAWAKLTDRTPTPDECDALMALDAAFRNPEEPEVRESPTEPQPAVIKPWPSPKSQQNSQQSKHSERAD